MKPTKFLTTGTLIASALCVFPALAGATPFGSYGETNLVSDIPGLAANTDPDLVNPWGITASATSPYWISDNGTSKSTLYNGLGVKSAMVVTIRDAGGGTGGTGTPTGVVFNSSTAFNGDRFIFDTEDGVIEGWRGALGTTAEILPTSPGAGSVYKGLAISTISGNTYLYAANFRLGQIDVTGSTPANTPAPPLLGNFANTDIPAGYAPFNIQNIGGKLYVTYAQQDAAKHDEIDGAGLGYVAVFDLQGTNLQTLISGGKLDAPWGVALAPATFGPASNDLLVGNFGDGTINAFDVVTGAYLGTLSNALGALVNDGLWSIMFGNGNAGSNPNTLFLTAGINGEADGLFAKINFVPEPGTLALFGSGLLGLGFTRRKTKRA